MEQGNTIYTNKQKEILMAYIREIIEGLKENVIFICLNCNAYNTIRTNERCPERCYWCGKNNFKKRDLPKQMEMKI